MKIRIVTNNPAKLRIANCELRVPRDGANSSLEIRHSKFARAFTLVEMLLVLVIIATLAAIVYPKMVGRGEQARVTAAQAQIAAFKTALDAFEVDNGYYPKGNNGLQDLVQQPRDAQNWHGPYLEKIPQDPWNHDYIYACPGKHNANGFDISSAGFDGREGTDDDIVNWQTK